jgi:monoamine oxidase
MPVSPQYDLAIVGGGIAGLYCCLRAHPDKKVALFEGTHRIGGKIETVDMAGFKAEYGAMRFDPVRQVMVGRLIQELDLETEPFPEYTCPSLTKRRTIYDLAPGEKELTTLELMQVAMQRVLGKSEEELFSLTEEELERIRREGRYASEYLWQQGLWNVFSEILSHDAIKYIISDGSFYHFIHENPSAAGWMITWVKMLQMSKYLRGIKHGMERLTDAMLARAVAKGVTIHQNHVLRALKPAGQEAVALVFANGQTVTARHAVLAIPSHALKAIKNLPENIRKLLGSVLEIPLLKGFFVVKKPWWQENIPNEGVTRFPARELHYYKQEGKGNIMVYADRPSINFWSKYVTGDYQAQAEVGGNAELPLQFARQLGLDPREILAYGIRDWGLEPYGAACHLWKPGVQSWKVIEALTAFPLIEGAAPVIHICGEAFSDYQGFMEGAVRTAHRVMTQIQGKQL